MITMGITALYIISHQFPSSRKPLSRFNALFPTAPVPAGLYLIFFCHSYHIRHSDGRRQTPESEEDPLDLRLREMIDIIPTRSAPLGLALTVAMVEMVEGGGRWG